MELLASKWKLIFLVGGVAGLAIFAFFPDYNTLQMSSDAKDFASTLGDDEGRATAANISDMIFALSYGVLGVFAFDKLASGGVAVLGTLLAIGAALADEIENVLVFINIKSDSLTNGDVDLMTTVGAIKWTLAGAAILMLIVVAVRARSRKE
jgi:hypothetical protein